MDISVLYGLSTALLPQDMFKTVANGNRASRSNFIARSCKGQGSKRSVASRSKCLVVNYNANESVSDSTT